MYVLDTPSLQDLVKIGGNSFRSALELTERRAVIPDIESERVTGQKVGQKAYPQVTLHDTSIAK